MITITSKLIALGLLSIVFLGVYSVYVLVNCTNSAFALAKNSR